MSSDYTTLYFNGIHVIESLRPDDNKTGQNLYNDFLQHQPERHGSLHVDLEVVKNREHFWKYIYQVKNISLCYDYNPIIHFEAHGSKNELELTSEEVVMWSELKPLLTEINVATNMNLLVTFAACKGGYFTGQITPPGYAPVLGVVGPLRDIRSHQLEAGFSEFYQELLRSFDITMALQRIATATSKFPFNYTLSNARDIFVRGYKDYRETHFTPEKLEERKARFIEMARESNTKYKYYFGSELRRIFRREINSKEKQRQRFDKFKRSFFMCDIYPENYDRFDLRSIEGEV